MKMDRNRDRRHFVSTNIKYTVLTSIYFNIKYVINANLSFIFLFATISDLLYRIYRAFIKVLFCCTCFEKNATDFESTRFVISYSQVPRVCIDLSSYLSGRIKSPIVLFPFRTKIHATADV